MDFSLRREVFFVVVGAVVGALVMIIPKTILEVGMGLPYYLTWIAFGHIVGIYSPASIIVGITIHILHVWREGGKCGLNVLGTLPGQLIEQGKYEDAINIESGWHEAIQKSEIPITPICLYKSIPDNVEDRFSEIHDLVIKHAVTSTGVLR